MQELLGAASLLAVVIYGAVRFADAAFYARLGTSPSAVGLSYAETLSRVAGAIVLFVAVVVLLLVLGNSVRRRGNTPLWLIVLLIIIGNFCTAIFSVLLPPSPIVAGYYVIPYLLVVAIFFAGFGSHHPLILRVRKAFNTSRRIQAISVSLAVVVVFGLAGLSGYRSAGDLIADRPIPCGCVHIWRWNVSFAWSSSGQGFLGVDAPLASVSSVKGIGNGVNVPENAFYLGNSDGIVVLFDPQTDEIVNVPADAVVIRVRGQTIGFLER